MLAGTIKKKWRQETSSIFTLRSQGTSSLTLSRGWQATASMFVCIWDGINFPFIAERGDEGLGKSSHWSEPPVFGLMNWWWRMRVIKSWMSLLLPARNQYESPIWGPYGARERCRGQPCPPRAHVYTTKRTHKPGPSSHDFHKAAEQNCRTKQHGSKEKTPTKRPSSFRSEWNDGDGTYRAVFALFWNVLSWSTTVKRWQTF